MSADNGIYIAKFPEGYRVIHAQAIDNIDFFPEGTVERRNVLRDYFGDSKVIKTEEEAWDVAIELSKEYNYLEYGTSFLGEFGSFEDENLEEKNGVNYMHVLPFEEKRQREIYENLDKSELINMLIARDIIEQGVKQFPLNYQKVEIPKIKDKHSITFYVFTTLLTLLLIYFTFLLTY
ncbi:MAG: hypothetical protein PHV11_08585 [Candidatus Bipolaricaulis sp.]|jgi:hypothetical protein|nr:hypothetical protein [Candidatus Bipolaricaulis sp.]